MYPVGGQRKPVSSCCCHHRRLCPLLCCYHPSILCGSAWQSLAFGCFPIMDCLLLGETAFERLVDDVRSDTEIPCRLILTSERRLTSDVYLPGYYHTCSRPSENILLNVWGNCPGSTITGRRIFVQRIRCASADHQGYPPFFPEACCTKLCYFLGHARPRVAVCG